MNTFIKKYQQTLIKDILLFSIPFLLAYFFMIYFGGFGSKTDWYSQHIAIADNFRCYFYRTHQLFPTFMNELGSGQSIYHFAYYGLFRYDILISYLFPFIKISVILPIIHLFSLSITSILFHHFLKRHISNEAAFFGSICLLLASPLLYHISKQVIFVIYMPFVILGLYGCDRLLSKQKIDLYLFSITMMILTSFYFTIGGALTCFFYLFMMYDKQIHFYTLLKKVILIHILALLISAFFWMPTAYALFTSKAKEATTTSLISLFTPDLSMKSFLYSPYSIGLTLFMLFPLPLWIVKKNGNQKWLAFIILMICIFPIFLYVLNLGLYARAKALIPLLPIIILLSVSWLDQKEKLSILELLIIVILGLCIAWAQQFHILIILDLLISIILLLCNGYLKIPLYYCYLPVLFISMIQANCMEPRLSNQQIQSIEEKKEMIQTMNLTDLPFTRIADYHENAQSMNVGLGKLGKTSIYSSIHNSSYNQFYYDEMRNNLSLRNRVSTLENGNPFFLAFTNSQYLITKKHPPYGYQLLKHTKDWNLYQTNYYLPFAYGTSNTIQEKDFSKLTFPNNIIQLLYTPITTDGNTTSIHNKQYQNKQYQTIENYFIQNVSSKGNWIKQENQCIRIDSKKKETMKLALRQPLNKEIMIVTMQINPIDQEYSDIDITINGMRNRLSGSNAPYPNHHNQFTFYIEPKDLISIRFSQGNYSISNIQTYRIPHQELKEILNNKTPVTNSSWNEKTATYQANLTMEQDGWFITSLPIQKGFELTIDGKKQPISTVNHAFIGAPITKGFHTIQLQFKPPCKKIGMFLSITTLFILFLVTLKERSQHEPTNS